GGSVPCGESCVFIPCITSLAGCSCKNKVCYYD
uniref:Parigidin-br1 n=1 Tax=Palicourea rigida TaxID=96266 RepID=PABR1_PALRI|nr:RecName: Full=Parigidin-br1 [Palicourea rigida]